MISPWPRKVGRPSNGIKGVNLVCCEDGHLVVAVMAVTGVSGVGHIATVATIGLVIGHVEKSGCT